MHRRGVGLGDRLEAGGVNRVVSKSCYKRHPSGVFFVGFTFMLVHAVQKVVIAIANKS